MSCCHLFRPCLVSKQKYIEGDCCQLCRSLWKCRSNQNGAHPYTNKTLNQLHTRVYMPGYSLMRQRDIIQQGKRCSSRERNNDKPSFNGQQLARGHHWNITRARVRRKDLSLLLLSVLVFVYPLARWWWWFSLSLFLWRYFVCRHEREAAAAAALAIKFHHFLYSKSFSYMIYVMTFGTLISCVGLRTSSSFMHLDMLSILDDGRLVRMCESSQAGQEQQSALLYNNLI